MVRRYNLAAQVFSIGINSDFGWIGNKHQTEVPTNDSRARADESGHWLEQISLA
jgi:hypothetical protein